MSAITPALLALCGALAIANWFVRPDRSFAWSAVLLFVVVMAAVSRWAAHRQQVRIEAEIKTAVITGSVMIVLSLGMSLATVFGAPRDAEFALRMTMIVLGLYYVVTGNAMPKTLPPMSGLRGDPGVSSP